ncbi:MAG: aminotransferase class I/II-fold pyridoxal phosphate-dependent enzyme [Blautia sp.]|nr:aminotransferase class I/II-fold pyridoxal phosphate-dependent enzyme [Blautia sp.]MDY4514873.1 aminotransferase class I/II-fold pyridoxal phosphate-dependent enzyme [Lachnospiraceae bacterium]
MKRLYDRLKEYQQTDMYPFHMPGHKRKKEDFINPFLIDITEIEGFDNLHHAEEILKEVQERAGLLYGSDETFILVNGSTCGILSAVSACTEAGGKILMARNCHKAVYHAAFLCGLEVVYLYPEREETFGMNGGVLVERVEEILKNDGDIQAVIITSPTYDGVVSDVKKIAETVHTHGIPLIVDEAHGAHFGFHSFFPESSVKLGADLVIHSLHKTLPSLTQTALLHVNGKMVDRERLRMYLQVYQSSSPSYVFMAGIDECIRVLEEQAWDLFEVFRKRLERFYERADNFSKVRLAGKRVAGKSGVYDFDRSKLIISVRGTGINGRSLQKILREKYHLELEMAAGDYALALTSFMDTEEGFERLFIALKEIDDGLTKEKCPDSSCCLDHMVTRNQTVYKICDAMKGRSREVLLKESEGYVCREFVYLYPPGIPMLVPGEKISRSVLDRIEEYRKEKYSIQGMEDHTCRRIRVMEDER